MREAYDSDKLFPKTFLDRLDEAHAAQARLHHLDSLLREGDRVREWLHDEGHDPQAAYKTLKARRGELLEHLNRVDSAREKARPKGELMALTARVARRPTVDVGNIGIRYPPGCPASEGSVQVPVFLEGVSVVPGGGAAGAITTITTTDPWEAPEPHYQGVLRVGFGFPFLFDLSYWLHNWRYVIPFPCAVCDSRLSYRVYFECGGLFGASALSASLSNWLNVREIADVSAGIDFGSLPDYEVWPIDRNWPFIASFMFQEVWEGVTLEGTFSVKAGKAPVLAILVGVIVGVASGRFSIFNAGFHPWEMQLFPPGGFPQPWHLPFHAKVHYRYEPTGGVLFP
jgi:hypothetical protein